MPHVHASACVLVVIDAQPDFYASQRIDVDQPAKDSALDRAAWVCSVAVALSIPVVATEEDAESNGSTAQQIAQHLPPGTPRFDKVVYGVGGNPPILAAVDATGRSTAVLIGMETDVCVAHSAIDLREHGLRVIVVQDAVFSAGAAHEFGLARLRQEGVELLSAKELYYEWLHDLPATRAFESANPAIADPPGFHL